MERPYSGGPCPPLDHRPYAIRFSVPVREGELQVRSSVAVCPRAVRLRGLGALKQVRVDGVDQMVPSDGVPLETFADRGGFPGSPRSTLVSDDDAVDDSSDGPPVDWGWFDGTHHLVLELVPTSPDQTLHVVITVVSPEQWPRASFRYADEDAWCSATVVDYNTRRGEWEGS